MERRKFEDSWKDSFKEAEVSPSENLWTNIELDLEKAEGSKMKRRVRFFQLLAAASVAFAMTFAGIGVYFLNERNENERLALNASSNGNSNAAAVQAPSLETDPGKIEPQASSALGTQGNQPENGANQHANVQNDKNEEGVQFNTLANADRGVSRAKINVNNAKDTNSLEEKSEDLNEELGDSSEDLVSGVKTVGKAVRPTALNRIAYGDRNNAPGTADRFANGKTLASTRGTLPAIANHRNPKLETARPSEADPVAIMLARLNDAEKKYQEEEQKEKAKEKMSEKLWTSVGFAAGSFNTVTSGSNANATTYAADNSTMAASSVAVSNSVAQKQSSASGQAYSVGLSLGAKISSRWVLQGGVNYLTQLSDYTTNAVVSDNNSSYRAASITELDKINSGSKTDSRLVSTASYNVNNSLQFLSVPMQAGYLLVNRKFGLQFNAGVSTDLFLRNTLTPDGGTLEKSTQSSGDDTPYRSVNFSGLVGTELSYRFSEHYRVALNPGLRYPFNSIYKSDVAVSAMPLTFDVGLRFRYIF